jgi:hypothetical protein
MSKKFSQIIYFGFQCVAVNREPQLKDLYLVSDL